MKQKLFFAGALFALLLVLLPLRAGAADVVPVCSLEGTVLTLTGETLTPASLSTLDSAVLPTVTAVQIGEGTASIGTGTLTALTGVSEIRLPSTLQSAQSWLPPQLQAAQITYSGGTPVSADSLTVPAVPERTGYTAKWTYAPLTAASCTVRADYAAVSYTATFRADGAVVGTAAFTADSLSVTAPAVPEKTGYTGKWPEYTLTAADQTIDAVYTPIEYTATFKVNGNVVATRTFTVETKALDEPEIPKFQEYTGRWADYTLGTTDLTIRGVFTPIDHTATFTVNGKVVATRTFNARNRHIDEPEVPKFLEYTGRWADYTLGTTDLTIRGVFTPIDHTATFKVNGNVVATRTFNARNRSIEAPEVPQFRGYTGRWADYSLGMTDLTIRGVYTAIDYTVTFQADDSVVSSQTYNARNRSIDVPAVPEKAGYTGAWEDYTLTYGDTTVQAVYTLIPFSARVDVSDLNIRSGPGLDYDVTGNLARGAIVTVTDLEYGSGMVWCAIDGGYVGRPYVTPVAEVPAEPAETDAFDNVYASYATDCSTSDWARKTNLRLACEAINGTVLQPGDVFSFNQVVGQRTPEKGYQLGYYFGPGDYTYGGGVCQVASTIFNAALFGNLQIVERTQHSLPVHYVPLGRDATVSWGTLDFQFRNDSPYTIRMSASCDGNTVRIALMTREHLEPEGVTVDVVPGSGYRLIRAVDGVTNYTTVSYY